MEFVGARGKIAGQKIRIGERLATRCRAPTLHQKRCTRNSFHSSTPFLCSVLLLKKRNLRQAVHSTKSTAFCIFVERFTHSPAPMKPVEPRPALTPRISATRTAIPPPARPAERAPRAFDFAVAEQSQTTGRYAKENRCCSGCESWATDSV